ncbi:MAG: hypothetical protein AAGF46_04135 [Pseudomonadota bacterium]
MSHLEARAESGIAAVALVLLAFVPESVAEWLEWLPDAARWLVLLLLQGLARSE